MIKVYKVSHHGQSTKGHLGHRIFSQYWPSQVEHVPALSNHIRCPEGWEWDALLCFRLVLLLQSAARRCKSDELLTSSGSIYPLLPPALCTDWVCDLWWSTIEMPSSSTVCNYAQVHCWSITGGPSSDLGWCPVLTVAQVKIQHFQKWDAGSCFAAVRAAIQHSARGE